MRVCAATIAAPRKASRPPAPSAATSISSPSAAARSASRKRSPRATPAPAWCASTATAPAAARYPGARVVRIDRDSARRRAKLRATLEGVRRGEADILVGTQLLAKGHDFPALTCVAVLNADAALVSTDYRAAERLFAVLMQV